jgi:prepilin-type N-terminal cleavage/methylation domain-containing protein
MPLTSTSSQASRPSNRSLDDHGFTLLEILLAMTLLAAGMAAVVGLFSGGMKSTQLSDQYMRAATLGDSRLAELELADFPSDGAEGIFPEDENFRWEITLLPYESTLNNPETGLMLTEVRLRVFWQDASEPRELTLTTLKLDGQTQPLEDQVLKSVFYGGESTLSAEAEPTGSEPMPSSSHSPAGG